MFNQMKVGIISQFAYENIGNKLQNYALQQVLLLYAKNVLTIKNRIKATSLIDWLREYSFISNSVWMHEMLSRKRKANHIRFHKRYICDSRYNYCVKRSYPVLKQVDQCMLFCAGSDQLWKPSSGRCGPMHYLQIGRAHV